MSAYDGSLDWLFWIEECVRHLERTGDTQLAAEVRSEYGIMRGMLRARAQALRKACSYLSRYMLETAPDQDRDVMAFLGSITEYSNVTAVVPAEPAATSRAPQVMCPHGVALAARCADCAKEGT